MSFLKKLKDKMKATTEDVAKKGAEAENEARAEGDEPGEEECDVLDDLNKT